MSIVFFGSGQFAVSSLKAVSSRVALVVTQPDRPSGRGMRMASSPVKLEALRLGLPVASPERSRSPEFVKSIEAIGAEILVVASYGQILSTSILEAAEHGGINLHGSILPRYRGAAPIQRAILEGETRTGVTLMQMDRGMDTGDIITMEQLEVGPDETYGELQDRLADLAARIASTWLPRLVSGDYPRQPQVHEAATLAPKVRKEEAELHFDLPAKVEYNRYRAFTPSPGAYVHSRFGRIRIGAARLSERCGEPGTVAAPNLVAFRDGSLEWLEVQPEGKKRMSGRDFLNGNRLRSGDSLIHA